MRRAAVLVQALTAFSVAIHSAANDEVLDPDKLFHKNIVEVATGIIAEDHSFQAVIDHSQLKARKVAIAKQRLAHDICKAINVLEADEAGVRVLDMGFSFTCLVWSTHIPEGLQLLFTYGSGEKKLPKFGTFSAYGAYFMSRCLWKFSEVAGYTGTFGRPCPAGAALAFEAENAAMGGQRPKVSCLIFYFKKRGTQRMSYTTFTANFHGYLDAVERLTDMEKPEPVDLTRLVEDIASIAWSSRAWNMSAYRIKNFVLIPVFSPEFWDFQNRQSFLSNHFGVAASYGHVSVKRVTVPVKLVPDAPPWRACLYAICIAPERRSNIKQ